MHPQASLQTGSSFCRLPKGLWLEFEKKTHNLAMLLFAGKLRGKLAKQSKVRIYFLHHAKKRECLSRRLPRLKIPSPQLKAREVFPR